jgi:hypothetical protein
VRRLRKVLTWQIALEIDDKNSETVMTSEFTNLKTNVTEEVGLTDEES